jgi:hypothetical protein
LIIHALVPPGENLKQPIQMISLFVRAAPECHPTVQRNAALFAIPARASAEIQSDAFYSVAQPDLLVGDEAGQAHAVWPAFAGVR